MDPAADAQAHLPGWYSPLRLLAIFCVINLINYVDRGAIASNGVNGLRGNATCLPEDECYGHGIQGDFALSNFEDGVLPAAFMVGLLAASPTFAHLSKTHNPFRLIGVGLTVWTVAVAACGLAPGFWWLVGFRMFVGVGEASFISLAAPFIDDNAPPSQKSRWLSAFYMCIPVGIAAGYVFGAVVSDLLGWRAVFFLEALAMLPFCVFGFVADPVPLRGFAMSEHEKVRSVDDGGGQGKQEGGEGGQDREGGAGEDCAESSRLSPEDGERSGREGEGLGRGQRQGAGLSVGCGGGERGDDGPLNPPVRRGEGAPVSPPVRAGDDGNNSHKGRALLAGGGSELLRVATEHVDAVVEDSVELWQNVVFRLNLAAYIPYTLVLGCYAYWGPKAAKAIFHMESADELFGAVTISAGIAGTFAGGLVLDLLGSTMANAFKVCSFSTAVGCALLMAAFKVQAQAAFIPLLAAGEFFLFWVQGPVAAISLWCVPPASRPFACALVTVIIHLCGDVPAPPLLGLLQDNLAVLVGDEGFAWRISLLILNFILIVSVIIWSAGAKVAVSARDYRTADGGEGHWKAAVDEEVSQSPLLGEGGSRGLPEHCNSHGTFKCS